VQRLLVGSVFLGSTKKFSHWGPNPLSAALRIASVAPNRKTGALPTVGCLRPLIQFTYPARTENPASNRNLRKRHTKTKTFIVRISSINHLGKSAKSGCCWHRCMTFCETDSNYLHSRFKPRQSRLWQQLYERVQRSRISYINPSLIKEIKPGSETLWFGKTIKVYNPQNISVNNVQYV
jgi:hypothetical protein